MKLYLIRHGESESNRNGTYTGHAQVHLTEKGVREAESIREYLSGIRFDKIYASDLYRAVETAKAAIPGCNPEETPLLRELNVGSLQGRHPDSLNEEERKTLRELGFKGFGGETVGDVKVRAKAFLDLVAERGDETVAAFTHMGILAFSLAEGLELEIEWKHLVLRNCAILILNYNGTSWRLEGLINRDYGEGNDF